jgi:hypothetical protein
MDIFNYVRCGNVMELQQYLDAGNPIDVIEETNYHVY